jgi:hypothetical protein
MSDEPCWSLEKCLVNYKGKLIVIVAELFRLARIVPGEVPDVASGSLWDITLPRYCWQKDLALLMPAESALRRLTIMALPQQRPSGAAFWHGWRPLRKKLCALCCKHLIFRDFIKKFRPPFYWCFVLPSKPLDQITVIDFKQRRELNKLGLSHPLQRRIGEVSKDQIHFLDPPVPSAEPELAPEMVEFGIVHAFQPVLT